MDDQSTISEIGKLFAKWCESQASADGPGGFDEAEFNALRDQIRQLERDACAIPPTSPQDVWGKVVMLLDQPTDDQRGQEAIVCRLGRSALGLPLNLPCL